MERDEFWRYLKKEAKNLHFKAYDCHGKRRIDGECGNRFHVIFKNSLTDSEHGRPYCGDYWSGFHTMIPGKRLLQGKRKRFSLRKTRVDTGMGLLAFNAKPLQSHVHWR